ncbi:MAG: DUF1307 domain-containing protein [Erysipelotrichaceae bacterium]|nr:DUF1307 domain-containing protein [Erysipelotrichaceae bacterium]
MKKLLCVLFAGMLLLSGCSEPEEKTTVCKVEMDGMSEQITLTALDDEVLSMKSVMQIPYSLYDIVTDEEKAMFESQMLENFATSGIQVESKSTEDVFVLEMNINFAEVNYQDLVDLGMMSESDLDSEMISLQKTLDGLTSSGYTCE